MAHALTFIDHRHLNKPEVNFLAQQRRGARCLWDAYSFYSMQIRMSADLKAQWQEIVDLPFPMHFHTYRSLGQPNACAYAFLTSKNQGESKRRAIVVLNSNKFGSAVAWKKNSSGFKPRI